MKLHAHAVAPMIERGASEDEVTATVTQGNSLRRRSAGKDSGVTSLLEGYVEVVGTI